MGYPLTLGDLESPRSKSQNFRIKYLEYHERHNVRHNGGQIGNHQWASG